MNLKLLAAAAVALTGSLALEARAQAQPNMEDMMKALGQLMAVNSNAASAVVDFRDLKALLPAELAGMKRTNAKGEKSGSMGMTVATAEGQYEDGKGADISIKISDMGGTGFIGGMANAAWAMADVDNESDDGYEKTVTIDGCKALEKYNTKGKDGEIKILVGKRFMVEVRGNDVPMSTIKDATAKVDLKKLAALQPKPAAGSPGK